MTTNNISKQKKWTLYDSRGILTPHEKRKMRNGAWKRDRHLRFKVKLKSAKALFEDLPLILNTCKPEDFLNEISRGRVQIAISPTQKFIKNLLHYYYQLEKYRIMGERVKKKRKLRVAFNVAWRPIKETIRETKEELININKIK